MTHAGNMDRWTSLTKDYSGRPPGSKSKDGYIPPPPKKILRSTQTRPTIPPLEVIGKEERRRQTRKSKSAGTLDRNPGPRNTEQVWQTPLEALPRGIRNMGHS
jgi:hypothetical protein